MRPERRGLDEKRREGVLAHPGGKEGGEGVFSSRGAKEEWWGKGAAVQ